MFPKKPLHKFIIGLLIIIIVVVVYLYFKFDYYEDKVIEKVRVYNKSVELFYSKLESLDSSLFKEYRKLEYIYLSEDEIPPEEYGTDYKGFIKWLENRTVEVMYLVRTMDMRRTQRDTTEEKNLDIGIDAPITISDTTLDKKLFYSIDELHDIYEEVRESKKNLKKKVINDKDNK